VGLYGSVLIGTVSSAVTTGVATLLAKGVAATSIIATGVATLTMLTEVSALTFKTGVTHE
jgi:hypothetical protein